MRFVCDEMLKRLGQWLRVAGYDVVTLPDGSSDRLLIERALLDDRILLTRDRSMAAQNPVTCRLTRLECSDLADCVADLNRRLPIDWHHRPFSRCMNCNTPLIEADAQQRRALPPLAQDAGDSARWCPTCRQLFWDGSHVSRMRRQLDRFARRR